jgi:hypothetical protein
LVTLTNSPPINLGLGLDEVNGTHNVLAIPRESGVSGAGSLIYVTEKNEEQ